MVSSLVVTTPAPISTSSSSVDPAVTYAPAPTRAPAPTDTSLSTAAPAPMSTDGPRLARSPSRTSAPSSTPAPTTARSSGAGTGLPGAGVQRALQPLEHPHHAQPALPVRDRRAPVAHALHEVLALDAQWLHVVDPRAPG